MTEFVRPVFTELIWMLAGGLIGALLALYLLYQTSQDKRVPAWSWGLPLLLLELSVVAGSMAGLANPELWTGTMAALQLRFLGSFAVLPFAGTLLLGLGVLGARSAPRDPRVAGGVALLVLLTAGATVYEGMVGGNPVFGWVRGGFYLALGGLAAVASLGTGRERGPGWAAQTAVLAFPLVVAAIEAGERALVSLMAMRNTAHVVEAGRHEALTRMLGRVEAEVPYGMLAVGLATCVPLAVFAVHQLRQSERSDLLALGALLAVPLVYGVGFPGVDAMLAAIGQHLAG